MTWISKSITSIGLALLAHACYSAVEHSALQSSSPSLGSTTTTAAAVSVSSSLPLDISLETLVATAIVCLGLALGTSPLRPVQWRVWAGKVEREGEEGFMDAEGEVSRDYVGNPFKMLETRPGFVDIRRQRKEFAEWVRSMEEKKEVEG
ncbi:magnesium transporter [Coniochaeta sp. 2T2.1]|nr:magnesium transporter [Coniochaeta sp. 2T2.1]